MTRLRPPVVSVRPRKGSDLEAEQKARGNDMSDIVHSWASMFAKLTKENGDERDVHR